MCCAVLADADAALPDGTGSLHQSLRVYSRAPGRAAAVGCRRRRRAGRSRRRGRDAPALLLRAHHPGSHPHGHRGDLLSWCS